MTIKLPTDTELAAVQPDWVATQVVKHYRASVEPSAKPKARSQHRKAFMQYAADGLLALGKEEFLNSLRRALWHCPVEMNQEAVAVIMKLAEALLVVKGEDA